MLFITLPGNLLHCIRACTMHRTLIPAAHLPHGAGVDFTMVSRWAAMKGLVWMVFLRRANEGDSMQFFTWRNAPDVRAMSRSSAPLVLNDHTTWFNAALHNPNMVLWVAMAELAEPVGMVRVDRHSAESQSAEVSIIVAPAQQGQGVGVQMLELAEVEVRRTWPDVAVLEAVILSRNPASMRLFQKGGFQVMSTLLAKDISAE